ncbi:MAG: hypothetical protein EB059_10560, partial [Alphaproteobacteria bacterium]|nr:hypothetical protein [Alphaproteobacteria bacterium]
KFLPKVKAFRKDNLPKIYQLGQRITEAYGVKWLDKPEAILAWYQLAIATTHLSDHPHKDKGVSALFVSASTGELIAVEVNRIPDGVKRRADYMLEGLRRGIIVCAERNGIRKLIAKLIGIGILLDEKSISKERNTKYHQIKQEFWEKLPGKASKRVRRDALAEAWMFAQIQMTQWRITNFNHALSDAAKTQQVLSDIIVITPPPTCVDCAPVIAEHRPKSIFYHSMNGGKFTRVTDNAAAEAILRQAGIRTIDLAQRFTTLNLN